MSLKTSILLVMCPLALAAGFQRTGTTAAQFLKLPGRFNHGMFVLSCHADEHRPFTWDVDASGLLTFGEGGGKIICDAHDFAG